MPDTERPDGSTTPKIQHTPPGIGGLGAAAPVMAPSMTPTATPPTTPGTSAGAVAAPVPSKIIRAIGEQRRHEEQWDRSPNTTGTGAIHVRTFHCKLTDEALVYLDQQINEWLDAHPQYEVKFTSTSVGEFTSKLKEPHLIVQVWV